MRERAYDLEAQDLHSSPGQSLLAVSSSKRQSTSLHFGFSFAKQWGFSDPFLSLLKCPFWDFKIKHCELRTVN